MGASPLQIPDQATMGQGTKTNGRGLKTVAERRRQDKAKKST